MCTHGGRNDAKKHVISEIAEKNNETMREVPIFSRDEAKINLASNFASNFVTVLPLFRDGYRTPPDFSLIINNPFALLWLTVCHDRADRADRAARDLSAIDRVVIDVRAVIWTILSRRSEGRRKPVASPSETLPGFLSWAFYLANSARTSSGSLWLSSESL